MSRHGIPDTVKRAVEAATPDWKWTAGWRAEKTITWKSKQEQVAWFVTPYDGGHCVPRISTIIRITVGRVASQYGGMGVIAEYTFHKSETADMAKWIAAGAKGDCPVPLAIDDISYKFSVKGMESWEQHTKRSH